MHIRGYWFQHAIPDNINSDTIDQMMIANRTPIRTTLCDLQVLWGSPGIIGVCFASWIYRASPLSQRWRSVSRRITRVCFSCSPGPHLLSSDASWKCCLITATMPSDFGSGGKARFVRTGCATTRSRMDTVVFPLWTSVNDDRDLGLASCL